jgi:hypothetical protein
MAGSLNVAAGADVDAAAGATRTTLSTHRRRDCAASDIARAAREGDGEAAVTAAAADTLREQTIGIDTAGDDALPAFDRDPRAVAAEAPGAAHCGRGTDAIPDGRLHREATVAAAASHRLCEDALGAIAVCLDDGRYAKRQMRRRVVEAAADENRGAIAGVAAIAADRHTRERRDRGRAATVAAAAADRLRINAMRIVPVGS